MKTLAFLEYNSNILYFTIIVVRVVTVGEVLTVVTVLTVVKQKVG